MKSIEQIKTIKGIILISLLAIITSCSEEKVPGVYPPVADFAAQLDGEDGFTYHFINASANGVSYSWDFGDGATSSDESPAHTYSVTGTYSVTLTVISIDDNEDVMTKGITIESPGGVPTAPSIIAGGSMDDDQLWTVLPNGEESRAIDYEFTSSGTLFFSGQATEAKSYQVVAYQPVELKANTEYLLLTDIKGGNFNNAWFTIIIGPEEPKAGEGYAPACPSTVYGIDKNSSKVIGLNFWKGCGEEPFEGDIRDVACDGIAQDPDPNDPNDPSTGGRIMVDSAGTYYFAMQVGNWNGSMGSGVTIDNVFLAEVIE
ncbi:PKD domain-containing protein [Marinoscillum sp. MHG1-6]|uniref:PKD domain-containing protein n=1 Tax=Marinoscillum sp. MHG1-6 TaxID=2959627 RepID=UPI0021587B36|nr:PKD domain-containing protein [Marinoscillum sp. MHG1-6]